MKWARCMQLENVYNAKMIIKAESELCVFYLEFVFYRLSGENTSHLKFHTDLVNLQ